MVGNANAGLEQPEESTTVFDVAAIARGARAPNPRVVGVSAPQMLVDLRFGEAARRDEVVLHELFHKALLDRGVSRNFRALTGRHVLHLAVLCALLVDEATDAFQCLPDVLGLAVDELGLPARRFSHGGLLSR